MAKVSVVIPVCDVEHYLRQCLESIINQTLSDIEIICVNDGSTDNSLNILEEYVEKDSRIKVFNQTSCNLSIARNNGFKRANGKYTIFLNGYDFIDTSALERLYTFSEEKTLDILFFSAGILSGQYQLNDTLTFSYRNHVCKGEREEVKTGKEMLVDLCSQRDFLFATHLAFFRTSFMKENNIAFLPDVYKEDTSFNFTCLMKAQRTYRIKDVLYYSHIYERFVKDNDQTYIDLLGHYRCFITVYDVLLKEELSDEQYQVVNEITLVLLRDIYKTYTLLNEKERSLFFSKLQYRDKYLFTMLLNSHIHGVNTSYLYLQEEQDYLKNAIKSKKESKSYKIGEKIAKIFNKKVTLSDSRNTIDK